MMCTREPRNTSKLLLPHKPLVSDVVENRTICGAFLADGAPSPNSGGDTDWKIRIRALGYEHLTSHHRRDSPLTFWPSLSLYTLPGMTDNTV